MIEETGTTPSIRETIASAVESHLPEVVETVEPTKEQKARDEAGRFAPEQNGHKKEELQTKPVEKPRAQRPSSWKKDYWNHWDKLSGGQALTPEEATALADYTAQREQDYAKGVSTYKNEWDKAKPVLEALNPIAPLVQQHGFKDTNQWLGSAVQVFQGLSSGTPQQKLGTLFSLAAQYKVPLEEIFEQAEDGRYYLNTQKFGSLNQKPVAQQQPVNIKQTVQEILQEERATTQVEAISQDQEKYPHFNQVRETMAGLLRAGLVEDLQGAYHAALNMPIHADLKASIDQAKQATDETKKREEAANLAASARAKVVSPRSSTPANNGKATGKGIRSVLEQAFDAKSGRV